MPTLADDVFAATYHPNKRMTDPYMIGPSGQRRTANKLRDAMRNAQRYIIDDDVARAATVFGMQHPDILLAMLPRARLTFPKVWVEWSQRTVLEEIGSYIAPDCPPVNGAYIEQVTTDDEFPLYRISELGLTTENMVSINATAILYSLDQPILTQPFILGERSDIARMSRLSKEQMDMTLLGSLYSEDAARYAHGLIEFEEGEQREAVEHRLELCRKLSAFATHTFSPFFPTYREMMAHANYETYCLGVRDSILEFSGTWRFIISLFALIQARDYATVERSPDNPARRRFVGNKIAPFLQHWRVKLALPRTIVLRKMISSVRESLPRPRHSVEGFWAERHEHDDECPSHVDVAETPRRYRCALCGRARYWVKSHDRGSSEVGYVTKDRVVTRRSKERRVETD